MIKAVFFDLGSTLWDDWPSSQEYWKCIIRALARREIHLSFEQFKNQALKTIETYSPSITRATVWRLVKGNREQYESVIAESVEELLGWMNDRDRFLELNPLFPGICEMLDHLSRKYALAVVSQNFTDAERWVGFHGLTKYFSTLSLSHRERLYKPDPRLYTLTCEAVGVDPRNVVMVGDRLDNDIWPANRLQMTTVRVLSEPYCIQQPRYHTDVPDYTIEHTAEMPKVVGL
jgi:HAD superfamily hydrolase (TIGR01549 family)